MDISSLQNKANEIREEVIKMLITAGSGHPAGSLGMADVFTALYFSGLLNLDPRHPWREDRDRIVLSSGHICPVWYATLAHAGYFSTRELSTLRKIDSRLQGHPHGRSLPGLENTSGSLGQGVSIAVGMALGVKIKWENGELKENGALRLPRVICLTGDGELDEGQVWEAAMSAAKYELDHLTFITDRNHIQNDGYTDDIMPLDPLAEKIGSFGFYVLSIDGHNIQEILNALQFDLSIHRRPVWIITNTIPGKGVDYMENETKWHSQVPKTPAQKTAALQQLHRLHTLEGKIKSDHE